MPSRIDRLDRNRIDEAQIVAGLLGAIERGGAFSQRDLARELGIALGLVNAFIKKCAKKGFIKIRHAPARRYAYYVTPRGLVAKTRLTAEFLSYSLTYFKRARGSLGDTFATAANVHCWKSVAVVGAGELAEIAILCALEHHIEVLAVVDEELDVAHFVGKPVASRIDDIAPTVDGLIVTAMRDSQQTYDGLVARYGCNKVLVPSVLDVVAHAATEAVRR
jgi:DNA-binding MarR family transcriptional regulator